MLSFFSFALECMSSLGSPLSTRLRKSTRAHPGVESVSMGLSCALQRSDGQGLEKLPRMRDTRSSTAEKTRKPTWGGIHCAERNCRASAALPSPADSSPSGSQRDKTTSQSFRSTHKPQITKMKRSNRLSMKIYLQFKETGMPK